MDFIDILEEANTTTLFHNKQVTLNLRIQNTYKIAEREKNTKIRKFGKIDTFTHFTHFICIADSIK